MRTTLREPSFLAGPRLVFALTGALTAAVSSPAAVAAASEAGQATTAAGPIELPADWRRTVEQGVNTYMKGVEPTEAVVMAKELPASTAAEVDAVTARIFSTMGCRGTPPASRDGVVAPYGEETRCFASFARSPGGYRIAVGAATPQAEAEAVGLARRLAAAGEAPAAVPTSAGDVATATASLDLRPNAGTATEMDAALRAALDAVPPRNMPVDVTLRRQFRYAGNQTQLEFTVWMLFANGVATSCMKWDPAVLAPTAEALASIKKDSSCEIARWRRVGNSAVFDDGEKGDTSLDDSPPPPRGTTYAGDFKSSKILFSSMQSWMMPGALLIDSEDMSLTRDGRFRLGSERFEQTTLEPTIKRASTVTGRYMVDRYLIAFAVNGKVERHFFLATGKPDDKELILYLGGNLLSNR